MRRSQLAELGINGNEGGLAVDSVGRTVLLVHAELMRRREAEGRAAREATEALTTNALQSLPSARWEKASALEGGKGGEGGDENAECCLCMDEFVADDEVRLLPCKHYFHAACVPAPCASALLRAVRSRSRSSLLLSLALSRSPICALVCLRSCIDRWFNARAYQQRSCPLCKADPLAGHDLHPPPLPDLAGGMEGGGIASLAQGGALTGEAALLVAQPTSAATPSPPSARGDAGAAQTPVGPSEVELTDLTRAHGDAEAPATGAADATRAADDPAARTPSPAL